MVHVVQVELHWNRYVTNEALENARMVADRGDLKQAREILDAASVTLGASPLVINGDPICLGLLSDLQEGVEKNTHLKTHVCLDQQFLEVQTWYNQTLVFCMIFWVVN